MPCQTRKTDNGWFQHIRCPKKLPWISILLLVKAMIPWRHDVREILNIYNQCMGNLRDQFAKILLMTGLLRAFRDSWQPFEIHCQSCGVYCVLIFKNWSGRTVFSIFKEHVVKPVKYRRYAWRILYIWWNCYQYLTSAPWMDLKRAPGYLRYLRLHMSGASLYLHWRNYLIAKGQKKYELTLRESTFRSLLECGFS